MEGGDRPNKRVFNKTETTAAEESLSDEDTSLNNDKGTVRRSGTAPQSRATY